MNVLSKKGLSRRIRGLQLMAVGVPLLLSKFLLGLAPLALSGYGLYRWLFKKSKKDGIFFTVGGVVLFAVVKVFGFLLWLPVIAGAGMLLVGGYTALTAGKSSMELEK